jgi:hypothetical protein
MIPTGEYIISNVGNGRCFDSNTSLVPNHPDEKHKRIHLTKHPDIKNQTHWFFVEVVQSENGEDVVLLQTDNQLEEPHALDGNCQKYIAQLKKQSIFTRYFKENDDLSPYLWHSTKHAKNHQWKLVPAADGSSNNYCIVNVSNNKCLDGDMSDEKGWVPRMIDFNDSTSPTIKGLLWNFRRCISTDETAPLPGPAHYMLINRVTGHCLQNNTLLRDTISLQESPMKFDPSHDWFVNHIGDGIYTLSLILFNAQRYLTVDIDETTNTIVPALANDINEDNAYWKLAPVLGDKRKCFHIMNVTHKKFLIGQSVEYNIPILSDEPDQLHGVWAFQRVTLYST